MGNTFALNTGSYLGGSSRTYGYSGNKVASQSAINRITRDFSYGYSADLEAISEYIADGDVTQALALYNSLFDDAKETANNYGYDISDKQIKSALSNAYRSVNNEKVTDSVKKHTSGSFVNGLKQGIPLLGLFAQADSTAEAKAELNGNELKKGEWFKEKAGGAVGGALSGAAVGTAIGLKVGGAAAATGVGAVLSVPCVIGGAIIGGVIGVANTLLKDGDKNL